MNTNEGEKVPKILSIDGKTQRGNGKAEHKANHIVSAVDENGFCLGQERVDEKSNEITAIPDLLENLNIKGHIITTDAMGTQRENVKKIRKKKADYVLALKGNQGTQYDDVKLYFEEQDFLSRCEYCKTVEKARGGVEKREYWHTEDIGWLSQKKNWTGLKSIAMTRNTIMKNNKTTTETRYFISSLSTDVKEIARAIRSHWMVESYHWHLDVTLREDADHTLNKHVAYNLHIIRKLALNLLKLLDVYMSIQRDLFTYVNNLLWFVLLCGNSKTFFVSPEFSVFIKFDGLLQLTRDRINVSLFASLIFLSCFRSTFRLLPPICLECQNHSTVGFIFRLSWIFN